MLIERRTTRVMARVGVSLLAVAADTFVCTAIVNVNPTTVGFVFLVTVLLISAEFGMLEAIVASLVATACYNFFFLPPVHTWTIAESHNWVALFAFLATSMIGSQLSERAKRRRDEAISRQSDLEQLHSVSRALLLIDNQAQVGPQIAREVCRVYELGAVAIYDGVTRDIYRSGAEEPAEFERGLRDAVVLGGVYRDARSSITITPFSLGGQPIGALGLQGRTFSDAALQALSNLVAIGIERARGQEAASRAEAARRSEEFKSSLLDAVAHEFKTPLTGIKAASSGCLSGEVSNPENLRELMSIVDKEADRLLVLVSEAIHLARIEAGKMRLQKSDWQLSEIVRESVKQMESLLEGRKLDVDIEPGLPGVYVDRELIVLVIRHLLDNALKYAPLSEPIRISVGRTEDGASVSVWNGGPGIAESERGRLFEKFYRGSHGRRGVAGTGMGLAISRQIMRAHGGDIRVESGAGKGVEFTLLLPVKAGVHA